MQLFEYILVLLIAILFSNFINRFVSSLSVPIIQIALGVCITYLYDFQLKLNPELFLMLFIAPLLFYDSMQASKKSLWTNKKPIFLLAFGLVFIAVVAIGYFVNWLIPIIPLAAAFALASALAPTDAVAVSSIAKKVKMPHKIMTILEGESLINDASGIVCFQFAVAAMITGHFSVAEAGVRFVVIAAGGALVGAILAFIKHLFVEWLRSLGIDNMTLHILIQILMPFIAFLIAEEFEVSGILAVVAAGLLQSFGRKEATPEMASFTIASTSIWSLLTFTMNGLVFLLLGTQLPDIIKVIWDNVYINNLRIILYIVLLTLLLMLVRFLWSMLIIDKKVYGNQMGRAKASLTVSLAGVRGAVTLATALSIPFALDDGTPFPQRALIIFISSGVILCSLLLANFILPFLYEREKEETMDSDEKNATIEILNEVIAKLNNQVTPETKAATDIVTRDYYTRIMNLKRSSKNAKNLKCINDDERELKLTMLEWEKEHTEGMISQNKVSSEFGQHYLFYLEGYRKRLLRHRRKQYFLGSIAKKWLGRRYHILKNKKSRKVGLSRELILNLRKENFEFVIEKLKAMKTEENQTLVEQYISEYQITIEFLELQRKRLDGSARPSTTANSLDDIVAAAFQIERDLIHTKFEEGEISRDTSKQMRDDISLLEIQLKEDFI